jgi:hypothetical protein
VSFLPAGIFKHGDALWQSRRCIWADAPVIHHNSYHRIFLLSDFGEYPVQLQGRKNEVGLIARHHWVPIGDVQRLHWRWIVFILLGGNITFSGRVVECKPALHYKEY